MSECKKSNNFKIGSRTVGQDHPPFVIAELSGNHGQSLSLAKEMVRAAAQAGADAIKLQTYTADSMTLDVTSNEFSISEENSLWKGESLHSLYAKAATPYEWHQELFELAHELGILSFSSPFDEHAVKFLDRLGVPCFKIASFELTDIPLIKAAAATGKPLIMSTGMATEEEIQLALSTAKANGAEHIVLLKCTSTYPAEPVNSNLKTIPHMQQQFACQIGLSDHTLGVGAAIAAIALGATVIEKHFVLDRSAGGVDAAFSMEPQELEMLCREAKRAWQALGTVAYGGTQAEIQSKKYRRSIYVSSDIKRGERFTPENIKIVRPAYGLAPKHWDEVIGYTATTDLVKGTALRAEHVSSTLTGN